MLFIKLTTYKQKRFNLFIFCNNMRTYHSWVMGIATGSSEKKMRKKVRNSNYCKHEQKVIIYVLCFSYYICDQD